MPFIKFVVPSIGSITQKFSLSSFLIKPLSSVKKDVIGEKGKLLKENLNIDLIFHEDKAIGIDLPNQVQFKIKSTDVALKGQTVSSSYKPAILENDIKIQVPPFIESGDEILLDTRTIEYIKKL